MSSPQLHVKAVNQYLPYIFLVGIGIGTTNYILHGDFNWLQWLILSCSTSFLVGFTLLWMAANKSLLRHYLKPNWKLYLVLLVCFFVIGIVATEIESLIKQVIFRNSGYVPFSAGNTLLSNSIISSFLGYSFFFNDRLFSRKIDEGAQGQEEALAEGGEAEVEVVTKIPVKHGENIQLIDVQDIAYFEAFDNYSKLFHTNGEKMLCDYSLIFLEKRLNKNFLRIHRKYIVNTAHIKQIIPHLNGRFLIQFHNEKLEKITSSKGYLKTMRKLVKIE